MEQRYAYIYAWFGKDEGEGRDEPSEWWLQRAKICNGWVGQAHGYTANGGCAGKLVLTTEKQMMEIKEAEEERKKQIMQAGEPVSLGAGCWLANPTVCPNGYTHPGYKWRRAWHGGGSSLAACEKRKAEWNAACAVTDTRSVYNPAPAPTWRATYRARVGCNPSPEPSPMCGVGGICDNPGIFEDGHP